MLDTVRQDLRSGWRLLLKTPPASAVGLLTIGVATGLMILTAAFVYSVLLRPLPFDHAHRLMAIEPATNQFEALELRSFRAQQTSFDLVHGYYQRSVTLTAPDAVPQTFRAAFLTAGTLDMLGARPVLGRLFRESEDFSASMRVTVIGERLWRSRFGADPAIVGRALEIDGQRAEVIGILPANFGFPVDEELWFPMDFAMPTADDPGSGRSFAVVGRLREGVAVEMADAEARVLFARIWGTHESSAIDQSSARVSALADRFMRPGFSWLLVVTGLAAAAVLLVACANVATLALAKALSRRVDIGVRTALGAGRGRIAQHLAVESLVLAIPGTLMGVWLAAIGLAVFERFQPALGLPYWAEVRIDPPVLLLAGALAIAVVVSASVVPALRGPSSDRRITLATRATAHDALGVTSWLVAGQVAGSCALLIGAGLLIRSGLEAREIDPGFTHAGVITGRIRLPTAAYPDPSGTMARVLQQLEATSAIESASVAFLPPGTGPAFAWSFAVDGDVYGPGDARPLANGLPVSAEYFDTLGIALRAGRGFTSAESRYGSAPVLIANRTLAERYLGSDPLNRRIQIGDTGEGPWLPVVGVVDDTYLGSSSGGIGLTGEPVPQLYLSWGAARYATGMLVLRTASDRPETLLPEIRDALSKVIPTVALQDAEPLTVSLERSTWAIRLFGLAFTVFAGVSLLISAAGVFGVVAFAVRERMREIGIRIALGASRMRVLRTVARAVALPVPAGLAVGISLSIPLAQSLRLLLFEVSSLDPTVYALVLLSLLAAVALAVCGPALRATQTDPITALRSD
jgi:predicted permease